MGIAFDLGLMLARTIVRHGLKGRLLQYGRQDIGCSEAECLAILRDTGLLRDTPGGGFAFTHQQPLLEHLRTNTYYRLDRPGQHLDDKTFFNLLGFEALSGDCDGYEGADLLFDLNADPRELDRLGVAPFDVVLDGGTMEHVFNTMNVLAATHRLLRPGGTVVHLSPIGGAAEHGFYQFSPTFFWDYYLANGYEPLESVIIIRTDASPTPVYAQYTPDIIALKPSAVYNCTAMMFFAARKGPRATSGVVPKQNMYQRVHERRRRSPVSAFQLWKIEQALADCPPSGLAIWCAGGFTAALLERSELVRTRAACIVDRNPDKHGALLHGVPVVPPEDLAARPEPPFAVLLSTPASIQVYNAIAGQLPPGARVVLA